MSFGANKDVVGHVEANSGANVGQEMVAADVIRATAAKWIVTARKKGLVKTQTLQTNSALEIQLCPFPQRRSINSVEVIKNWTVWLEEDVNVLVGPPGDFRAYSEILMEQKISAEGRISTAADGLILVVDSTIAIACGIAADGAITES